MAPSHNQVSINGHFQGEKMGQIMFFFSKQELWSLWYWLDKHSAQTNMDFKCSLVPLLKWWELSHFSIPDSDKTQTLPSLWQETKSQLEAEMCRNKTSIDIINTWKHAATITGHWRGHWCHYEHVFKQSHHQQLHQGQATALTQYTAQHIQSLHRLVPQVNCICRILWDPITADNIWNSENNNREQNVLCPIISPQIHKAHSDHNLSLIQCRNNRIVFPPYSEAASEPRTINQNYFSFFLFVLPALLSLSY